MPTLFKIFMFLFLQQGVTTVPTNEVSSINWETVLLSCNATLTIQADSVVLEQALSRCSLQDFSYQITRDNINGQDGSFEDRALVTFKNLPNATRNKMMEQLQSIQGAVRFQWNYQYQ